MSTLHNGTPSEYDLVAIGRVERLRDRIRLKIDERYRAALEGLDGFSHAIVLWWFDKFDTEESRSTVTMTPPFEAPELGVFALKAPMRPNPVGMSVVRLLDVDAESGTISVPRIDAFDETPILDIKPYMPAFDRVDGAEVPEWASSWRDSMPADGVALEPPPGE
jgi:tRNA-Thr(GGU) m(6)t(6)A37 methyltransferase TsaA